MNIEFLNEPRARRWWLLQKGMETTSFRDALLLAQATEDFLFEKSAGKGAVISASDGPAIALKELRANDVAVPPAVQVVAQVGSAAVNHEPETPNAVEATLSGPDKSAADLAGPADDVVPPGCTPLPAPEHVIRFLRQNDDVVVSAGPGEYLVNGRFREGAHELVARANRIRARRNEQPFAFVPALVQMADKLNDSTIRL